MSQIILGIIGFFWLTYKLFVFLKLKNRERRERKIPRLKVERLERERKQNEQIILELEIKKQKDEINKNEWKRIRSMWWQTLKPVLLVIFWIGVAVTVISIMFAFPIPTIIIILLLILFK